MGLNEKRLEQKLKEALSHPETENNIEVVAQKLAKAIIEEIRELKIQYKGGLITPTGNVMGNMIHTVK